MSAMEDLDSFKEAFDLHDDQGTGLPFHSPPGAPASPTPAGILSSQNSARCQITATPLVITRRLAPIDFDGALFLSGPGQSKRAS